MQAQFNNSQELAQAMMRADTGAPILNETRIEKSDGETGDFHTNGHGGIVKGSITAPDNIFNVQYLYLVHFDGSPEDYLTIVIDKKIKVV